MTPLTVLTGFLGAGKTTLVAAALREARAAGLRVGVVVNDLGAPGVDAETLLRHHAVAEADLVNLSGGSVGGGLGEALAGALSRMAGRYDRLLLETSGTTDPAALLDAALLDAAACPTVVLARVATALDAYNFALDYADGRALFERLVAGEQDGVASPELLLARQVQTADLVLLTKPDLAGPEAAERVAIVARLLNPSARIVPSVRGGVPPGLLFPAGRFDAEAARARLARSRPADAADAGLVAEVVADARPLHPERLRAALHDLPRGVFRGKGVFWMASRPAEVLHWNQAGSRLDLELAGYWKASVLASGTRLLPEERAALAEAWVHPVFGDRTTELVLLGTPEAVAEAAGAFRHALCTPREVRQWRAGAAFSDPWPTRLRALPTA